MSSLPSLLTVTDHKGNSYPVLSAKRISPICVLVVREWHAKQTPYVVHTFNAADGGFHNGHYCESLARANEVFANASL